MCERSLSSTLVSPARLRGAFFSLACFARELVVTELTHRRLSAGVQWLGCASLRGKGCCCMRVGCYGC